MGKKYVIEVEDEPFEYQGTKYWPASYIPRVFFDAEDLTEMDIYEESTAHKFEVGDVCKLTNSDSDLIISRITPDCVSYMWDDGTYGTSRKSIFEHQARFVRHVDEFYSFIKRGLK